MKSLLMLSALGLMAAATDAPSAAAGAAKSAAKSAAKKVTVKVLSAAVGEDDQTYLKGQTFETTADRAAALGDSVEVVK